MKVLVFIVSVTALSLNIHAQTDFQYYNIALVKFNMGNYNGAMADLSKAIEINPDHMSAYVLRGSSHYNLEDFESAVRDYTTAIEIATRATGGVKLTITDRRGNVIESGTSSGPDPDLAITYYNRALARYALGEYQEAVEDYTLAIDNENDKISTFYNRGIAKDALGDYAGAAEDYSRVLEIDPGIAQCYFRRGKSLHKLGQLENACSDWRRAGDLGMAEATDKLVEHCNADPDNQQ